MFGVSVFSLLPFIKYSLMIGLLEFLRLSKVFLTVCSIKLDLREWLGYLQENQNNQNNPSKNYLCFSTFFLQTIQFCWLSETEHAIFTILCLIIQIIIYSALLSEPPLCFCVRQVNISRFTGNTCPSRSGLFHWPQCLYIHSCWL